VTDEEQKKKKRKFLNFECVASKKLAHMLDNNYSRGLFVLQY
jgi:hypothetical protein